MPSRPAATRNAYPPNAGRRASSLGALLAFAVMVSEPVYADESEVKRTWDAALVLVVLDDITARGRMDAQHVQANLAKIPPGIKLPTIIYAHGCSGLWSSSLFAKLANWGFAVIAPDSFARSGRVATCGSAAAWRGTNALRREEIRYAAQQARNLPWVDPDNLFLLGDSEGGGAVTSYGGDEFKARIASGTSCWRVNGSTPLLVVNFSNDPWMTRGYSCHGGMVDEFVRLQGKGHWPWGHPKGKKALIRFLAEHTGASLEPGAFEPEIVARSADEISIRMNISIQDVYDAAKTHCESLGKTSYLTSNAESDGVYTFSCD